jgi:hypothetical protein
MNHDTLIDRIRQQVSIDKNHPDLLPDRREPLPAVASEAALRATEQSIGFAIPLRASLSIE